MTETISGRVASLNDKLAVIKTENGPELFWPVSKLPANTAIGAKVKLTLAVDEAPNALEKTAAAKKTLNDILNVEPDHDDR